MSTWLKTGGKLFVHIFVHKCMPYHFEVGPSGHEQRRGQGQVQLNMGSSTCTLERRTCACCT